jgi:hypothetical protein
MRPSWRVRVPRNQAASVAVPAHQDDLLRAEPRGGQHGREPDGAVADDRDRAALSDPGGDDTVVTCAEDVGQGEQRGQQRGVLADGQLHQRALGLWHPHGLALPVPPVQVLAEPFDEA